MSIPQSEEALQVTHFVLPWSPGSTAFLYNEELVFVCSTGTSRAALPDEKISFNSPGGSSSPVLYILAHLVNDGVLVHSIHFSVSLWDTHPLRIPQKHLS